MGEIVGREKPDEVVVIGGHIDSWDVGQGAHDDGGGIMAALEAVALIKKLGLQPRRTIRVVFWTNEENGGRGGVAYREWAARAGEQTCGRDRNGWRRREADRVRSCRRAAAPARGFAECAARSGSTGTHAAGDCDWSVAQAHRRNEDRAGQRRGGYRTADGRRACLASDCGLSATHYFDYHHTQADTFDKIVPEEFKRCAAAMAVMSYVLADLP